LDVYLADRKARGFNGFLTMAIMPEGGTYGWSRRNAAGDEPFTTIGHLDTPNTAYFNFIELIIDKAVAHGFVVQMFYTYAGFGGGSEGWWSVVNDPHNTQNVCFGWGRYLGNRFKNKSNLIWMAGGDYTMPPGEGLTRMRRIMDGIRSAGARQLAGSEWGYPDTLVTDQQGFTYGTDPATSLLQLDSYYGQGANQSGLTYATADRSWARSTPVLPGFIQEPMQAYATYAPLDSSRPAVRKYQHWSITAGGIAGSVWGVWSISDWHADWRNWLGDPACVDQQRAFSLYQSIPWWLMRPSGTGPGYAGRTLVVAGGGTGSSKITSSITSNGSHLLAYVPPTGTAATAFSIDLRSMAGPSRARWWNPTTGGYTNITGGAYTLAKTIAAQPFTTPGNNGSGTNDWMLVLDTNGVPPAVPIRLSPAHVMAFLALVYGIGRIRKSAARDA